MKEQIVPPGTTPDDLCGVASQAKPTDHDGQAPGVGNVNSEQYARLAADLRRYTDNHTTGSLRIALSEASLMVQLVEEFQRLQADRDAWRGAYDALWWRHTAEPFLTRVTVGDHGRAPDQSGSKGTDAAQVEVTDPGTNP